MSCSPSAADSDPSHSQVKAKRSGTGSKPAPVFSYPEIRRQRFLSNQKIFSAVRVLRSAIGGVQNYAQAFIDPVVNHLVQVADHTGLKSMLHIASVMFSAH